MVIGIKDDKWYEVAFFGDGETFHKAVEEAKKPPPKNKQDSVLGAIAFYVIFMGAVFGIGCLVVNFQPFKDNLETTSEINRNEYSRKPTPDWNLTEQDVERLVVGYAMDHFGKAEIKHAEVTRNINFFYETIDSWSVRCHFQDGSVQDGDVWFLKRYYGFMVKNWREIRPKDAPKQKHEEF
jgi:hypothetical protein